jgi:hypothetical protein
MPIHSSFRRGDVKGNMPKPSPVQPLQGKKGLLSRMYGKRDFVTPIAGGLYKSGDMEEQRSGKRKTKSDEHGSSTF